MSKCTPEGACPDDHPCRRTEVSMGKVTVHELTFIAEALVMMNTQVVLNLQIAKAAGTISSTSREVLEDAANTSQALVNKLKAYILPQLNQN